MRTPLPSCQKGLSPLGVLVVLLVVSFFGLCAFRMIPIYMDDRFLQASLQSLADDAGRIHDLTDDDIRSDLGKTFLVNNIRNFSERDIKIHRDEEHVQVSMKYEVRVPIFANIDAVLSFHNVWDSDRPNECCKPPRV